MTTQTTSINPAAQTLLSTLKPFIRQSVICIDDIVVPGKDRNCHVDVLLVGEYETVAIRLTNSDDSVLSSWIPEHPLGMTTEIYSISSSSLFYHLDDFIYLLSIANPSLFLSGKENEIRGLASEAVADMTNPWLSGRFSLRYPVWAGSDLEISRFTSTDKGFSSFAQMDVAA